MSEHAQTSSGILGRGLLWHGHCHELPRAVDWFQSEMNSSQRERKSAMDIVKMLAIGGLTFWAVFLIWLGSLLLKRVL